MKSLIDRHSEWLAIPTCLSHSANTRTYYHFFAAILLPLLSLAARGLFQKSWIHVLSCGQFDSMLEELNKHGILRIQIEPDLETVRAKRAMGCEMEPFYLESMELYFHLEKRFCLRPAAVDWSRLVAIRGFIWDLFPPIHDETIDVLLINRAESGKGHGENTRHIPNVAEIFRELEIAGYNVAAVSLEGRTLAAQIEMFSRSRVVIAQHGSALVNMMWSPGNTTIIELVPPEFQNDQYQYFAVMAEELELPRVEIKQGGPFEPVDIDLLLKSIPKP